MNYDQWKTTDPADSELGTAGGCYECGAPNCHSVIVQRKAVDGTIKTETMVLCSRLCIACERRRDDAFESFEDELQEDVANG